MEKINVKLSTGYRNRVLRAAFSIGLFALVYLVMVILGFAILGLAAFGAIGLISLHVNLLTIVLSLGLVSLGVLIVLFLLKFLFKSGTKEREGLLEIDLNSQPDLKAFLQDLVSQIGTSFPKRVYLSNEVNAAVFYDSTLLSIFFPARKNLIIGVGLVNAVTKNEFQAILGHEFGHFSQRSMKVGSYVYYVNELIYNLLYDNEGYETLASKWAQIHGFFAVSVSLAYKVAQGAQWVLKGMYSFVNKEFLGLSREMEFHADEVAARLVGGNIMINSLQTLNGANTSLNEVFNFYEGKLAQNRVPQNLYSDHVFVMDFQKEGNLARFTNFCSEIEIKDQWASHPSQEDRIKKIQALSLPDSEEDNTPASSIFKQFDKLSESMSQLLYRDVQFNGPSVPVDSVDFAAEYREEFFKYSFPEVYHGYFDFRNPVNNWSELQVEVGKADFFGEEPLAWVAEKLSLENDLVTLQYIQDGFYSVKTFDYRGEKYKRSEAPKVSKEMKVRLEEVESKLQKNDARFLSYVSDIESSLGSELKLQTYLRDLTTIEEESLTNQELVQELNAKLEFTKFNTPFHIIQSNFRALKPTELLFKSKIRELVTDERFEETISPDLRQTFESYVSKEWEYFGNEVYFNENLDLFIHSVQGYASIYRMRAFYLKKSLLSYLESIMKSAEMSQAIGKN